MQTNLKVMLVGYLVREVEGVPQVFLGTKTPTPGARMLGIDGKKIGYGGKFNPTKDSSEEMCFVRELKEESGVMANPQDVTIMARVLVKNTDGRSDRMLVYALVRSWSGTPADSREIVDGQFYPLDSLPDAILDSDRKILPRIVAGEKIGGWMEYNEHMQLITFSLPAVDSFIY